MLDLIVIAMVVILLVMYVSVFLVRSGMRRRAHRIIQILLTVLLTVSVIAFEIDVRLFTDWRELARPSPYYESGTAETLLWIHLVFAIPTPFVWGFVIYGALTGFGKEAFGKSSNEHVKSSGNYARVHRWLGWTAAIMMTMTALTGWVFYWVAFVA